MADGVDVKADSRDIKKKRKRDSPVNIVVDNREQAFHVLMQANARFEMATEELVLARDALNEAIEGFKQIMPESFHLEMRTFWAAVGLVDIEESKAMPFLDLKPYEKQKKQIAQDTGLSQETLDTIGDVLDMIAPSAGAAGMATGMADRRERSLFNRLGFLGALAPFAAGAFLGRPKKSQPGVFDADVESGQEIIDEGMLNRIIKEKGVREGVIGSDVNVSTAVGVGKWSKKPKARVMLWDAKAEKEVDISESDLERILPNRQEMLMLETESRGFGQRQSFTKTMDDIKQAAGPKGQEKSVSDMRLAAPRDEPVSVEFAGKGVRNSKVNSFLRMLKLKPTDDPDELFAVEETMGVIGKELGSSDLAEVLDELGVSLIRGAGNLGYLVRKGDGYRLTAKGARQLLIANGLKEK